MPSNSGGACSAHLLGDERAPVAALRDESRVSEALHQHDPGARDADRGPSRSRSACRRSRSPAATESRRRTRPRRVPPCAVGLVSGSMIFSCSMIEPGHPCVTMSGSAFLCFERTWMKWMSSPSISVTNCGRRVEPRLALAPVVVGRPVARELLDRRELHALRCRPRPSPSRATASPRCDGAARSAPLRERCSETAGSRWDLPGPCEAPAACSSSEADPWVTPRCLQPSEAAGERQEALRQRGAAVHGPSGIGQGGRKGGKAGIRGLTGAKRNRSPVPGGPVPGGEMRTRCARDPTRDGARRLRVESGFRAELRTATVASIGAGLGRRRVPFSPDASGSASPLPAMSRCPKGNSPSHAGGRESEEVLDRRQLVD